MASVRLDLDALGTSVRIEAEAALAGELTTIFGTFPATRRPPRVRYRLGKGRAGYFLARAGRRVHESPEPLELVSVLEGELANKAAELCPGWLLHAAALADDRGAVVLAGLSGAGKSTLCAALVARGWRYLSDERVAVDSKLRALGLARPIGMAVGARVPAGLKRLPHPAEPRRLLLHPPSEKVCQAWTPVRMLVSLRHDAQAIPGARPLTPGAALTALWGHCARPWPEAWRIALDACSRLPAIELAGRTVAGACNAMERAYSGIP